MVSVVLGIWHLIGPRNFIISASNTSEEMFRKVDGEQTIWPEDTLVQAISNPVDNLFPFAVTGAKTRPVWRHLFESLGELDPATGAFKGRLASKWIVEETSKSFLFQINPKAHFWDGTPVTAADVEFSLAIHDDHRINTEPWASLYLFYKDSQILGPKTIRINVRTFSYSSLVRLLTAPILSKNYYSALLTDGVRLEEESSKKLLLGSGPWQVAHLKNNGALLVRDQSYWDKANWQIQGRWTYTHQAFWYLPIRAQQLEALRQEQLSVLPLTLSEWHSWSNQSFHSTVLAEASLQDASRYEAIVWNTEHPVLRLSQVRRALSYLLPLKHFMAGSMKGFMRPAIGPYSPTGSFHPQGSQAVSFSPDRAVSLLQQTGYQLSGQPPLMLRDGEPLTINLAYPIQSTPQRISSLQSFVKEAAAVGVSIVLQAKSLDDLQLAANQGTFEGLLTTIKRPKGGSLRMLFHSSAIKGGTNLSKLKNDQIDAQIEELESTFKVDERVEFGKTLQKHIIALQPFTFLVEPQFYLFGLNRNVIRPDANSPFSIGKDFWQIRSTQAIAE